MNVSVKVYEAAKAEAHQYGEGDPQEYYDCIPITEYAEYEGRLVAKSVDYEKMVNRFNEHQNRLLAGDWYGKGYLTKFDGLDDLVAGFDFNQLVGSGGVTVGVTNKTTAKVKKPTNKKELEKENEKRKLGKNWKETVRVMLNESVRLGYNTNSENLKEVFDSEAALYEFGAANVGLIHALFGHTEFYAAVNYTFRQRIAEVKSIGYE
jgi:hypothetical protein